MRIVAIINQKGGVGKTTTAVNIAHALALDGNKVLLLDCDPQGHLSASFGLKQLGLEGVDQILLADTDIKDVQLMLRDNLYVVPAGDRLGEMEFVSSGGAARGYRLKAAMEKIAGGYDYVFIDCPPSNGMIGMNCLLAAEELLVPVSSDFLALHGLSRLMGTIAYIEDNLHTTTKKWIAITRFQERRLLAREVRKKLIEYFPNQVLETAVRETVVIAESPGHGQSIFDYRPKSRGAKDYASLAEDMKRCRVIQQGELKKERKVANA